MKKSIKLEIVFLLLFLVRTGFGEGGTRVRVPLKRSYQVPRVTLINDPQSLQYYAAAAAGPLYTIPTVLIPNQLSLSTAQIAGVVVPPSSDVKPVQELQETSTVHQDSQKSAKSPAQFYKQKHRSHSFIQTSKRPLPYINSVYGHPVRLKPVTSVQSQKQKVSSISVQPSVDLSGHFNSQEAATNAYSSTIGPPVASTYGPPKAVDFQYKTRLSGTGGHPVYLKLKGPSHRHSFYSSKKMRVYSHVHKDHIHNHYLPTSHSLPVHKPKYAAPTYLPPSPSTPPTYIQHTPVYAYQTATHVKFLEDSKLDQPSMKDQQELHQTKYSPGDVTQAIIKHPGVINNYDANIPLHVPSKKPYQFEVNEILKNSELHFVEEHPAKNTETVSGQNGGLLQYTSKVPYQNVLMFSPHHQLYSPLAATGSLDAYNLPGVNTYQTNHIATDQDLGTSETVRVPVAVIRGAHNIASQGMFGFTVKRQDEPINRAEEETKKAFTPSKRTSDWIPMSASGVPLTEREGSSEKLLDSPEEKLDSSKFFSTFPKKETKIVRPQVGDIISGKIPEEFSPKNDIVSGKIPFLRNSSSERNKRKGSVVDVYPSSSSEVLGTGDTSDLVVSSVIKFS